MLKPPKKVVSKKESTDLVVLRKMATMHMATEKGKVEQDKEITLGVSVFPAAVKPSSVKVRFHGTFNMGNYNSLQASIEIEGHTLPHPDARLNLCNQLRAEALELLSKGIKEAAMRLFNSDMSSGSLEG